jgi:hypothetical protein
MERVDKELDKRWGGRHSWHSITIEILRFD